ncbi:hypothetical protein ABGB07_42580 [Micromonosporaceae bacterium B7E4]
MTYQEPQRRRRYQPSKRVFYTLWVVGLVLVLAIASGWSDVVLNPWARSLTGDPLLTGTWKGDLPVAGGGQHAMMLRLGRVPWKGGGRCSNCATIEGTARVCAPDKPPDGYAISGRIRNWSGTEFRLDAAANKRQPGTYTDLGRLDGEWDGRNTIRLRTEPYVIVVNPDGSTTLSSDMQPPDPEVTIELRRAEGDDSQTPQCP